MAHHVEAQEVRRRISNAAVEIRMFGERADLRIAKISYDENRSAVGDAYDVAVSMLAKFDRLSS